MLNDLMKDINKEKKAKIEGGKNVNVNTGNVQMQKNKNKEEDDI